MTNPLIATFSLVARDEATADLGVAVASKFLAVGAVVPYAKAGVGAVATQSYVNSQFGTLGLDLLAQGKTAEDCLNEFKKIDPNINQRQFGMVSSDGSSLSFTGEACHAWAGGRTGHNYAAQGNILANESVVAALETAFLKEDLSFPERMLGALLAADLAGGDKRGRQSAALLVVGKNKGYGGQNDRWIDLRVDDHPTPIPELKRLLDLHQLYLDKPKDEPMQLDPQAIIWLQSLLKQEGLSHEEATGNWTAETEAGLWALYGIENLEERWLGSSKVDPVAWHYLKKQFS